MSIFNIQSLEEKAKIKKIELEENKKSIKTTTESNHSITSENIFVTTIHEIEDIANNINANIAYNQAKDIDESNPSLFKDVLSNFMNVFMDINTNLKEKCLALKTSIDILKDRLDGIDTKQTIRIKKPYEFTDLDSLTRVKSVKTLIDDQLRLNDQDVEYFDDIKTFRNTIRNIILDHDDNEYYKYTKLDYIEAVYWRFRYIYVKDDDETIDKGHKTTGIEIESWANDVHLYPIWFEHDINKIYNYLKELHNSPDIQPNDIITKHIEVILEEYALLYSARADAIVEYTDKIREYLSMYVEVYGGEDDDE